MELLQGPPPPPPEFVTEKKCTSCGRRWKIREGDIKYIYRPDLIHVGLQHYFTATCCCNGDIWISSSFDPQIEDRILRLPQNQPWWARILMTLSAWFGG